VITLERTYITLYQGTDNNGAPSMYAKVYDVHYAEWDDIVDDKETVRVIFKGVDFTITGDLLYRHMSYYPYEHMLEGKLFNFCFKSNIITGVIYGD